MEAQARTTGSEPTVARAVAAAFLSAAALLTGCSSRPRPADAAASLKGSSWRLVEFVGGDDTRRSPRDRSRYTLQLEEDGTALVRVDCNRGRGRWRSSAPGQIEFDALVLTRAECGPDSLHDLWVRHWPMVRSYVIQDGHLVLSLAADGGTYEFEPAGAAAGR